MDTPFLEQTQLIASHCFEMDVQNVIPVDAAAVQEIRQ